MTITEFANELIATLKTSFPDLFEHATFAVHTVPKPGNVLLTGITVSFHDSNIAPCYYIDEQYNQWLNGMPVTAAASDLAEVIRKTNDIPCNIDVNFIRNFESARDHIFPRLIDTRPGRNIDYVADRVCNPVPGTSISVLYDVEKKRVTKIVEDAKAAAAAGLVVLLTKFCDPEEFDYPLIKRACSEAELPCVLIEIDRQMVNYEQARTAIETFKDLL